MNNVIKAMGCLLVFSFSAFSYAETLSEAMQACSRVDNSLKRLVCFDQLAQRANGMQDVELPEYVERHRAAPRGPAVANNYPNAPQGRTADPEDQFGKRAPQPGAVEELVAVISEIETFGRDRLRVTLDNGQVWYQSTGDSISLKVGDTIIISKGMMGAFYMKEQGSKRRMLVRRSE